MSLKKTVASIERRKSVEIDLEGMKSRESDNVPKYRLTRASRSTTRNKPRPTDTRQLKCIICNNASHKKQHEKFRIETTDRAQNFLHATKYNQDDTFGRIADLTSICDLHAHPACLNGYITPYRSKTGKG